MATLADRQAERDDKTDTGTETKAQTMTGEAEPARTYWTVDHPEAALPVVVPARSSEEVRALAWRESYGGRHGIAPWLNLWGADPQRPLPDWDGLTMKERARRRGFIIENGQTRRTKQKTESQAPIGITEGKRMSNADRT